MKIQSNFPLIISLLLLTACGGGGGTTNVPETLTPPDQTTDNGSQQSTSETLYGLDSTNRAVVGTPVTYDLDVYYTATDKAVIAGLPQIAYGDCSIESSTSSSFTVYPKSVGECRIDYNIASTASLRSSESDTNTGMLRLAVSQSLINDNELPRRSVAMFSENGATTVDLTSLLGSDWPTGTFELDNVNALQVMGVSATATPINGTTIEITPASSNQGGVTRILYSLTDQTTTKLGTIDVAVSVGDGLNRAPVITQDYYYKPENGSPYIENEPWVNTPTHIANVPAGYITDPDNDPLTVTHINGSNSFFSSNYTALPITVADPTPIPLYNASGRGGHGIVTYTVSDGKGGFAIGYIHYYAQLQMSIINQAWDDIYLSSISVGNPMTFKAPMVKQIADYFYVAYDDIYTTTEADRLDGKAAFASADVIRMTYDKAEKYCADFQGRLPTPSELETMLSILGPNVHDTENPATGRTSDWPVTVPYWSSNKTSNNTAQTFDLYDGTTNFNESVTAENFVTCISLDLNSSIVNFAVEMTPISDQSEQGRMRMKAVVKDPHGDIAPYQKVKLEVINGELSQINSSSKSKALELTANVQGEIYFDYYELNASTDETIVAKKGNVVIGTYAYAAGNIGYGSVMRNLDIHYTSMLSQSSSSGANAAVSYYNGVTLWHNRSGARFANIYKEGFLGKNFSVYMAMTRPDALSNTGVINLALQQHTSPFTGTPNTGTNAFPGLTTGNKNLAINFTLTNGNSLKYTVTNGRDSVIAAPNTNSGALLANTTLHFWVDYNNTTKQMKIYAAEADVKPTNATVTVDNVTWGDIDPSAPYWIQVSSYSNQNTSAAANLTTLKFNSWD